MAAVSCTLIAGHKMVLELAAKEQARLKEQAAAVHAQAEQMDAAADLVMSRAVQAIREDLGIPVDAQVHFRMLEAGDGIVMEWKREDPSRLALVPSDAGGEPPPNG